MCSSDLRAIGPSSRERHPGGADGDHRSLPRRAGRTTPRSATLRGRNCQDRAVMTTLRGPRRSDRPPGACLRTDINKYILKISQIYIKIFKNMYSKFGRKWVTHINKKAHYSSYNKKGAWQDRRRIETQHTALQGPENGRYRGTPGA